MKLNTDQTVAVSTKVFWSPMKSCPIGVKVQLVGAGGVAVYSTYKKGDSFWIGWSPVPAFRRVDE